MVASWLSDDPNLGRHALGFESAFEGRCVGPWRVQKPTTDARLVLAPLDAFSVDPLSTNDHGPGGSYATGLPLRATPGQTTGPRPSPLSATQAPPNPQPRPSPAWRP